MQFKVGFRTDVGRRRSQNQDCGLALPEQGCFTVCDGMGGHRGGEIASQTAVEVISTSVKKSLTHKPNSDPKKVISEAIRLANQTIYQQSLKNPQIQGMGTTATVLLFIHGKGEPSLSFLQESKKYSTIVTIGHVGDSRCYFLRPQSIWQATRDHSLVQEKLRAGIITRAAAKIDKMKNVITRSVGFEMQVDTEIYQMGIQSGDCFLLCSDGLSGMLEDHEIMKIIQKQFFEFGDAQKAVDDLIYTANAKGGDDNITSLLVQMVE